MLDDARCDVIWSRVEHWRRSFLHERGEVCARLRERVRPDDTGGPMTKVTLIGAGSVEFTRNLLADLCSYRELHGSLTIALHDIDAERLATAERLANRAVAATGAGYAIEAHLERKPAFDG